MTWFVIALLVFIMAMYITAWGLTLASLKGPGAFVAVTIMTLIVLPPIGIALSIALAITTTRMELRNHRHWN